MRRLITSFLFFYISSAAAQPAKPALEISHLTGNFYIYITYHLYDNEPYTANGMYLITEEGAVLFDSPWDTTQFQPLLDSIKTRHGKDVVICIATHFHADRTAGLEYYKTKGIKTFTTKQTDILSATANEKRAEFVMLKDSLFTVGKYRFQTYYPGKGHAPDNIVIWFEKEKILYGGCFIKSIDATSPGYLGDASLSEWPKAIRRVQSKFKQPAFIVPGHESWMSKDALNHTAKLIKEYLEKNPK